MFNTPPEASFVNGKVVVKIPSTVPNNASNVVDPTFAAFAFEERSFYRFAGPKDRPNTLSVNVISAVAKRTKTRPVIRVGGTSMNFSSFDPNQAEPFKFPKGNEHSGIPLKMIIGPSYFDCFANIDADYLINLPMRPVSKVEDTVAVAKTAYTNLGAANVISMELGNEVNWYDKAQAPYTPSMFAQQFTEFSTALAESLGFEVDRRIWTVGAILGAPEAWRAETMYNEGLDQVAQRIAGLSAHYYQKFNHYAIDLPDLMNHNAMKNKVDRFTPSITHLSTLDPPIPFTFNEVGCSLSVPNHPTYALARSFGAALWQVDYMLYSMTKNVQRINLQSGLGFRFSLWQPSIPGVQDAEVYPNLYAHLFVADFISDGERMQAINVDLGRPKLAVYAGYESGRLARVALLNLRFYDGLDTENRKRRGRQAFVVQAPTACTGVLVKRLTSSLGATALESSDVTWAGETWTAENDGLPKALSDASEEVEVNSSGFVEVVVADSEVAMLEFR